tara:strand:- start:1308 stop:2390 length:1083 start_codon:yes stop_codon:yes gene_type:complete
MRVWLCAALLLGLTTAASASDDWHYTLRPGDTLWKVCQQFAQEPAACWRDLASHNSLNDPHSIRPGQTLLVPISWLKEKPIPAQIQAVIGEVMLYPAAGGETRQVRNGDTVAFGDALETGASASARVLFADQSEVVIKPASLLVVNRYRRFLDQQGEQTELRLERGNIRNKVTPASNDERTFKVFTPGAVAAVRGTEYYVSVDAGETTRNEVVDGRVDVSARGTRRDVQAGFATLARLDEAPIEPVPLLPAPSVALTLTHQDVTAVWPAQADAASYWVEWYRQRDNVLLGQASLPAARWQQALPVGDYRLLVRAVDGNGLRGHESWTDFTIEPAPEPEPEKESKWDLWVFLGGAALLLAL